MKVYVVTFEDYGRCNCNPYTSIQTIVDSVEKAEAIVFNTRKITRGKHKGQFVKERNYGYDYEEYEVQ